jgi:hypothetical protein
VSNGDLGGILENGAGGVLDGGGVGSALGGLGATVGLDSGNGTRLDVDAGTNATNGTIDVSASNNNDDVLNASANVDPNDQTPVEAEVGPNPDLDSNDLGGGIGDLLNLN